MWRIHAIERLDTIERLRLTHSIVYLTHSIWHILSPVLSSRDTMCHTIQCLSHIHVSDDTMSLTHSRVRRYNISHTFMCHISLTHSCVRRYNIWHIHVSETFYETFSRRDRLVENVSDNRMCQTIQCLWHMNVSDRTHSRATEWEQGIRRMKCLDTSIVSHIPSALVSVCDTFYHLMHSIVCSIAPVSQTDTFLLQMCQSATYSIVSVYECVSLSCQTRTLTHSSLHSTHSSLHSIVWGQS